MVQSRVKTIVAASIVCASILSLSLFGGLGWQYFKLKERAAALRLADRSVAEIDRVQLELEHWLVLTDLIITSERSYLAGACLRQKESLLAELEHLNSLPYFSGDLELGVTMKRVGQIGRVIQAVEKGTSPSMSIADYELLSKELVLGVKSLRQSKAAWVESSQEGIGVDEQNLWAYGSAMALVYALLMYFIWSRTDKSISGPLVQLTDAVRTASETRRVFKGVEEGPKEVRELNSMLSTLYRRLSDRLSEIEGILETASSAILTVREDLTVRSYNSNAQKLFGHPDLKDLDMKELVPLLSNSGAFQDIMLHKESGILELLGHEFEGVRHDGSLFPTDISISQLELRGETHYILIIRDETQRRQAELQLRQAQKFESIGQLASGVAHEINTPLQAIESNLCFFEDTLDTFMQEGGEAPDLEFLREEVPIAFEQCRGSTSQIIKILRSLKVFAGEKDGERVLGDIHQMIDNVVTVSQNEWKYAATVDLKLDDDIPAVPCVAGEIRQVFTNLLLNAADAIKERQKGTPEHLGRIEISTSKTDKEVCIRIEDNGTGIPKEIQGKIFDPFFTSKGLNECSGQGLAYSLAVVADQHFGKLTFETEPGRTAFDVRLPLS